MKMARLQLKLPEFSKTTFIDYNFHIFETDIKYDMIIGQDLMRQLGTKKYILKLMRYNGGIFLYP